jgi:hypothetical protein
MVYLQKMKNKYTHSAIKSVSGCYLSVKKWGKWGREDMELHLCKIYRPTYNSSAGVL